MARPRTPTQTLENSGAFVKNPKRGRARRYEPKPLGPLGEAPERFSPEQKACWEELSSITPHGVLTAGDRIVAELTARLMAKMRKEGLGVGETAQLITCLSRMGLTPADRSKISVPEQPGSKLDDFLAGNQQVQ